MTINQIETMTDNTTMIIAIAILLLFAIVFVITTITSAFQKPTNKKPQNSDLVYKIPSYKDQMVKFNFDESIRDLSEEITLSAMAQAVVNTYNQ